ncbi:MAG: hypothetical protein H6733_17970 [Alphaproteobacteria bacterium]|nr:hypothetical protein [Alphaproteobacteria bacterium]
MLDLPDGLPEPPAEVIVLTDLDEPPAIDPQGGAAAIAAHLDRLASRDRPTRTRAELDARITAERRSWT